MAEPRHGRYRRHRKRKLIRRSFVLVLGALIFMGVVWLIGRHFVGQGSTSPQTPPDSGGDNSAIQYK